MYINLCTDTTDTTSPFLREDVFLFFVVLVVLVFLFFVVLAKSQVDVVEKANTAK